MRQLNGDGGIRTPTFLEVFRKQLITSVSRSLVIHNNKKKDDGEMAEPSGFNMKRRA